jgi:hypothetical protein
MSLAKLQAQNPQLNGKVKLLKLTCKKRTLTDAKLHEPLLVDIGTPEEATLLVKEGLVYDHEPKNCKLFHSECIMAQCL